MRPMDPPPATLTTTTVGDPSSSKEDDKYIPGPLGTKLDDSHDELLVTVVIPGVKKPHFFGLIGKNTEVEIDYTEWSLRLYTEVKVKKHGRTVLEKVLYKVERLPGAIDVPTSSYFIKDGQVVLTLKKSEPGSWANILDQHGLETSHLHGAKDA